MSIYRKANIEKVEPWGEGAQLAILRFDDGSSGPAIAFEGLTGTVAVGDEVIANTTAVELELGSGGYHFILWNLSRFDLHTGTGGHIMKLRYTPIQMNVKAVEEELGQMDPGVIDRELEGLPVIAGSLHSQLLPAALAYRHARPDGRLVYVMTDGGSLPCAFSRTVAFLRTEGLIESAITSGHAFGGDLEAVNVHGALLAARRVCGATAVIVLMGPGIVGTASVVGFSGLEQAVVINAVASLGGSPIAIPRITFADRRARHRGLSHHTTSALRIGALAQAVVVVPVMGEERAALVREQIEAAGIRESHEVLEVDAGIVLKLLDECGFETTVMGRTVEEEPEYFMAAGAAGLMAAQMGGE